MFLLPFVLSPLYVHGEAPTVEVPQTSALSGYLSHGDVITAVDGSRIRYPSDWTKKMIQINSQMLQTTFSGKKGYCVPHSWLVETNITRRIEDNFSCPGELAIFASIPCLSSSLSDGIRNEDRNANRTVTKQCLNAKYVIKLKKCGDGWEVTGSDQTSCACLEEIGIPIELKENIGVIVEVRGSIEVEMVELEGMKTIEVEMVELEDIGTVEVGIPVKLEEELEAMIRQKKEKIARVSPRL
ncbi:uncharacterized protein A4U43_UnF6740 [Asparagus officinalis]|uniref:PDZ domain-containing protein n=1 Tax=Asparagus officinalis TaxID=4686 RepID=A0A1R3L6E3_ASPOF|nr:uncharacterized protein A4U43_UnF6740 [Asparagus officinalis]